jgi:hypothetical protein
MIARPIRVAGLAFGGGPLEGRKVVRFVFLDEGGISRDEPFAVVAGVFVHGDEQLIPLENELERLKQKHIPEKNQKDFIFHAMDIWSGAGKVFKDREKWPLPRRLAILHDLARMPCKFDLPIVYHGYERNKFIATEAEIKRVGRQPTDFERHVAVHAVAFCVAILRTEEIMRVKWTSEVAQLVAEDNDQVRGAVRETQQIFLDPSKASGPLHDNSKAMLPLKKIRGSVHFAKKSESPPLQLADVCAFIIRGHLAKHPHNPPLYNRIRRALALIPVDDVYFGPEITASPPNISSRRAGPFIVDGGGNLLIPRTLDNVLTE